MAHNTYFSFEIRSILYSSIYSVGEWWDKEGLSGIKELKRTCLLALFSLNYDCTSDKILLVSLHSLIHSCGFLLLLCKFEREMSGGEVLKN